MQNILTGPFPEPYILIVSEQRIAMVDLESNYSKFVVDEPNVISNLLTDPFEEKMYFKSGVKVKQANFDGSDIEVIHENEKNPIKIFASDWVERKMYWMYTTNDNYQSEFLYNYYFYAGDVNFDEGKMFLVATPSKLSLVLDPYARLVMLHVRMIPS